MKGSGSNLNTGRTQHNRAEQGRAKAPSNTPVVSSNGVAVHVQVGIAEHMLHLHIGSKLKITQRGRAGQG